MKLPILLAALVTATSQANPVPSRELQDYTDDECTSTISDLSSGDTDGSGGISQDEFYALMASDPTSGAFADLPIVMKVAHKSLACYCTVLGGGEDCCVGSDAEINVSLLTDDTAAADTVAQYTDEVCSTILWAYGIAETEPSTVTTETTVAPAATELPEATPTTPLAVVGTTIAPLATEPSTTQAPETTEPPSDDVPETTEPPSDDVPATTANANTTNATEAPGYNILYTPTVEVADDGKITFTVVTSVIDFKSLDPLPESYDADTYFDADEVVENVGDNGILEDMQKGFVGLALDVFSDMDEEGASSEDSEEESDDVPATTEADEDAESESDDVPATSEADEDAESESDDVPATTTTEAPKRKLRGSNKKLIDIDNSRKLVVRHLQDISFLIGGNLTTKVEDVECPANLNYAPEGAPCLEFVYSVTPPAESAQDKAALQTFAVNMSAAIANGDLHAKIVELNPDTLVTGAGSPGGNGTSFDSATSDVAGATEETSSGGGLGTGAIVGIVVVVVIVLVILLYACSRGGNKEEEANRSLTPAVVAGVGTTSSDDEVAGTAARTATAVALKPDSTTKLGFTYKMYPDQIVVASVKEGSIFDGTPLKEGNEIISINGQEVKGMDREAFRQLLTNLPEGNVTIVMNEIVPMTILRVAAIKPEPTSKLGFTYKFIGNKIVVASVKEDGIFADTELKKGQEVVSINSIRVAGMNKDQFRGLLQSLPQGKVIITVKDIIEFSIMKIETEKPTPNHKLGFMYKVLDDGVFIASVNDTGIFANTDLRKGQEIVSINGKNVQKMTKESFRAYLSTIPAGTVTFVVVDKPKKWSKSGTTLVCTAVKETDDTKLGFTYKVMKDGAVIETVGEYSIFAPTDLAPGQEIVSVNGTPTAGLDRMEFRDLLTSLKAGKVTIVVTDRSPTWDTKGTLLVVNAEKENETTKLGFTYKVLKNQITVESVKPESIFGSTELAKGQEIMSINGTVVRGMDRDSFRELLLSLPAGTVRIVVSDMFKTMAAKGGVVTVTAVKESDDTKLGFTYKVLKDAITIETVKEEGIFGGTELANGQKILRINGTPVKGMDREAFRDLLGKLTAGPVTIDLFDESKKAVATVTAVRQATQEETKEEEIAVQPEEDVVEDIGVEAQEETVLSPEEDAHLEEVKAEVRRLVEQATPGKSADDMLAQYEGREDELLSHLRKFVQRSQQ